jgi:hypothetical protein
MVRLRDAAGGYVVLASLRWTAFAPCDSLACKPKLGEAERVVRLRNAARGAGCSRCYGGHQPSLEEPRWLASQSSPEEGGEPDGERRLVPEVGIEPTRDLRLSGS